MTVSREQLDAYRRSDYAVFFPRIVFRIGRRSAALDRLLEAAGSRTAAFLTAANPRSERRPATQNLAALRRMRKALKHPFRRAEGRSADRRWREPSLLVIGIARREAEALGRAYGQNAIVFVEKGRAAELVLL
jgi:hypothetical protein